MYRNSYQRGLLTIFFSGGSCPLKTWDVHCQDGYVTQFLDQDIKAMVVDVRGTNISTTYMVCPKGNKILGIFMPFLVMIVKNLKKYFSFEVTILDETGTRRRFRVANFQSTTQILPMSTVMPIGLADGWNQIQFNLAEFTQRAYKKQFVEVQKIKINANIRLRRVYFCDRLLPEEELPAEYRLYFPLPHKAKERKEEKKDEKPPEIAPESKPLDKVASKGSIKQEEAAAEQAQAPATSVAAGAPEEAKQASLSAVPEQEAPPSEATTDVKTEDTEKGTEETPADTAEPQGEETTAGETVAGETVTGETPAGETPVPETPASETPVPETPAEGDTAAPSEGDAPPVEEAQEPAEG